MNCDLTDYQREKSMARCRSFDCKPCNEFGEKLKSGKKQYFVAQINATKIKPIAGLDGTIKKFIINDRYEANGNIINDLLGTLIDLKYQGENWRDKCEVKI